MTHLQCREGSATRSQSSSPDTHATHTPSTPRRQYTALRSIAQRRSVEHRKSARHTALVVRRTLQAFMHPACDTLDARTDKKQLAAAAARTFVRIGDTQSPVPQQPPRPSPVHCQSLQCPPPRSRCRRKGMGRLHAAPREPQHNIAWAQAKTAKPSGPCVCVDCARPPLRSGSGTHSCCAAFPEWWCPPGLAPCACSPRVTASCQIYDSIPWDPPSSF